MSDTLEDPDESQAVQPESNPNYSEEEIIENRNNFFFFHFFYCL